MSMPAWSIDADDPVNNDPVNNDDVKMPERHLHRQTIDVIALAASGLIAPELRIFRDMNWYPTDDGGPIAPDMMVLARAAIEELPRSYRQDQTKGPAAVVAVEIASDTDTFASLRAKARRYQRLGTTAYVVVLDHDQCLLRLAAGDSELVTWTGRPMPELGDLRVEFDGEHPFVRLPDGTTAHTDADLVDHARQQAQGRADAAEGRAEALAARLRALGVDPDEDEPG